MEAKDRQIENTIPVLPVSSLTQSIEFYTRTVGFGLDWGGEDGSRICSVSRDGCRVMLCQGFGASSPQIVWIGLEDETIFEEWKEAGVTVRQEPKNWTWAYEMKFEDPDGNVLWVGTEPRHGEPFEDAPNDQQEGADRPPTAAQLKAAGKSDSLQ